MSRFLHRFLQAELGTGQPCFGLRPSNLVPPGSHCGRGSPVGRSPGLDTEPALSVPRCCFCTTCVCEVRLNVPVYAPRQVPRGLACVRSCWELREQLAALPAVLVTFLFKIRDDKDDNYEKTNGPHACHGSGGRTFPLLWVSSERPHLGSLITHAYGTRSGEGAGHLSPCASRYAKAARRSR